MEHQEDQARKRRRDWLLRLFSQSLQRQQVGQAAACRQRIQGPGPWRPGEGWAGQSDPQAMVPPDTE